MSLKKDKSLSAEQTFKEFYNENFFPLRMYIFAKSSDTDLSNDMAQEAFIRLWNNKEKVEYAKAKSFLYTVAGNLFLDHVRHQKVKINFSARFEMSTEIKDPQYLLEMQEFKAKIEDTIQAMPTSAREVFLLSRMENMSYSQIAESLGLTVKAIEKRMQKALEIMSALKLR